MNELEMDEALRQIDQLGDELDNQRYLVESLRREAQVADVFYKVAIKDRDHAWHQIESMKIEQEILANTLAERDQVVQDLIAKLEKLQSAAMKVLVRWDTPRWSDTRGTTPFMLELRDSMAGLTDFTDARIMRSSRGSGE